MNHKSSLLGFFIYLGTAIGLGVFALPYAFNQSGFFSFFYLLFLVPAVFLTTLAFSKILTLQTNVHTIAGSAGFFLGAKVKHIALAIVFLEMGGALLAYFSAGGIFLNILSPLISPYLWGIIFALIIFALIFFDIKSVGASELYLTIAIVVLFLLLSAIGFSHFRTTNLALNLGMAEEKFLAYGVILFSLAGWSAVPALRELFGQEYRRFVSTIGLGTVIVITVYLLFTVATVGAFFNPSQEALSSYATLGGIMRYSGALLGVLNVLTSALVLGLYLKNVFRRDYNLSKNASLFLMAIPIFMLYIFGISSFVKIISFVGGVAIAADAVLIWLIYQKFMCPSVVKKIAIFLLIGIFLLGAVYEVYFTFFK